jgi:hypothetical protein
MRDPQQGTTHAIRSHHSCRRPGADIGDEWLVATTSDAPTWVGDYDDNKPCPTQ